MCTSEECIFCSCCVKCPILSKSCWFIVLFKSSISLMISCLFVLSIIESRICISLIISDAGHHFIYLLAICICSSEKCLARDSGDLSNFYAISKCCSCSQWPPSILTMTGSISTLRQARQKPVPYAAPRKKSKCWIYGPVLYFSPQGEAGSWRFFTLH